MKDYEVPFTGFIHKCKQKKINGIIKSIITLCTDVMVWYKHLKQRGNNFM